MLKKYEKIKTQNMKNILKHLKMNFVSIYFVFLIFLESSETHFDLFTSRIIGTKRNNFVIYGDILVNFLRILSTKSTNTNKNHKMVFSIGFRTFHIFYPDLITFERGRKKNSAQFFFFFCPNFFFLSFTAAEGATPPESKENPVEGGYFASV